MEISLEVAQKLEIPFDAAIPPLGIFPQRIKDIILEWCMNIHVRSGTTHKARSCNSLHVHQQKG